MGRIGGAEPRTRSFPGLPATWRRGLVALAGAAVLALVVAAGAVLIGSDRNDFEVVAAANDGIVRELAPTDAYQGPGLSARVAFSPGEEAAAVEFIGLPSLPPEQTYEAWLIVDGLPTPAGLFSPDGGRAVLRLAGEARPGALVGITIEPAGGSQLPTGDVLFLTEL